MAKRFQTNPGTKATKTAKAPGKKRSTKVSPAPNEAAEDSSPAAENSLATPENSLATPAAGAVTSDLNTEPGAMDATAQPAGRENPTMPAEDKKMEQTLTLTKSTTPRKSERIVIFNGPLNSVQFLRTAFGETVPDTITVSGDFAEPKAPKVPRAKETPEERKARLAAMPKLTLAEKVAKAEARAQALREKLAKKAAEAPTA